MIIKQDAESKETTETIVKTKLVKTTSASTSLNKTTAKTTTTTIKTIPFNNGSTTSHVEKTKNSTVPIDSIKFYKIVLNKKFKTQLKVIWINRMVSVVTGFVI